LILAVETSSPVCGVSLFTNSGEKDCEILIHPRVHAEKLAVICKNLLQRNDLSVSDLEAVAVSGGPGSFTGLRIGMSFAKGLVYANNIPLVSVNTLFAFRSAMIQKEKPGEKAVFIIPSHRDFIYTLNHAGNDIQYLKKTDFHKHYPGCEIIFSNQDLSGFEEMERRIEPILPAYIGRFYYLDSSISPTVDYDTVKIYYGLRYEPVQWKP
jgi:tRNA A37 threonylcarbamoyladenosine modification protein TsaB